MEYIMIEEIYVYDYKHAPVVRHTFGTNQTIRRSHEDFTFEIPAVL